MSKIVKIQCPNCGHIHLSSMDDYSDTGGINITYPGIFKTISYMLCSECHARIFGGVPIFLQTR